MKENYSDMKYHNSPKEEHLFWFPEKKYNNKPSAFLKDPSNVIVFNLDSKLGTGLNNRPDG